MIDLVENQSITSTRRAFKSQNGELICLWKIMSYDFGKFRLRPKKGLKTDQNCNCNETGRLGLT
ncbi:MAG: hypothetical protein AMJ79_12140 [Phycisphaerae bacterium SM23_30]|nr:MAG: hypothetical protein AMJ79_12140 [Phycisphaerae bacterium SM23_30]